MSISRVGWFVLALLVVLSQARSNAGQIYWTDTLTGVDAIFRADLDGTNVETVVPNLGNPQDVDVDVVGGKVYWTDDLTNKVQRANLDGTGIEDLVTGVEGGKGIRLDVDSGKMIWVDNKTKKVFRANLDGSSVQTIFDAPGSGPHFLVGLDLGFESGKAYWADADPNKIQRKNMDGTGTVEDVITTTRDPQWVAVDEAGGKLYWSTFLTNEIWRANLDGSNEELIVSNINNVEDIAIDVEDGKIYWAVLTGDKIQRANLDGTNIEDVLTGLGNPHGITLVLTPIPEPSTFVLAGLGLVVLLLFGRTSRRRITAGMMALACVAVVSPAVAGQTWLIEEGGNGHFYELNSTLLTWDDAKAAAELMRIDCAVGRLVTFSSDEENDFVNAVFNGDPLHFDLNSWIGLSDADTEGEFAWVTSEPLGYLNWAVGEPDGGMSQNHVALEYEFSNESRWVSQVGSLLRTSIIEFDVPAHPPLTGDISDDCEVDIADFTLWADAFGETTPGQPEDLTNDGEVDIGDFTIWADNFGNTPGPSANEQGVNAVPEPSAVTLLGIGTLAIAFYRWRQQRHASCKRH